MKHDEWVTSQTDYLMIIMILTSVWVGSSLTSDSVTSDSGRLKLLILENLIYWLQHSRSLKVLEKQEQTKKSWIVRILESVNYFDSTSWGCTETRNTGSVFPLLWSTGRVHGTGSRDGSTGRVHGTGQRFRSCWTVDVVTSSCSSDVTTVCLCLRDFMWIMSDISY